MLKTDSVAMTTRASGAFFFAHRKWLSSLPRWLCGNTRMVAPQSRALCRADLLQLPQQRARAQLGQLRLDGARQFHRKAPTSKLQAPMKLQASNFKEKSARLLSLMLDA